MSDNIYPFPELRDQDAIDREAKVAIMDEWAEATFKAVLGITVIAMLFAFATMAFGEGSALAPETSPRPEPRPVAVYLQDTYGPAPATIIDMMAASLRDGG